jgi:metal-dependent hydrolase (beta-lactamase superfamily II)
VIGGFHLGRAPEERIRRTVEELRALGVGRIAGLHCTGQAALRAFREAFGDAVTAMAAGSAFSL